MRVLVVLATVSALVAADPASLVERKGRARVLLEGQDYRAALDQASALHRESADDIAAYQLMAAAHMGLGDYTESEKEIQWMLDLRIGKADAQGWELVARFREATGDIEGALDAVNLAYRHLAPEEDRLSHELLVYSARLLLLTGRPAQAEQVLQRTPEAPDALEVLARLRSSQGRRGEAVELLRRITKIAPTPHALYLLAEETRDSRDYAAFERAARERIDSPDNANRELVLYLAGPGKRAAEALEVARRESGRRHDIHTLDALAVALEANGSTAEARSVIARALAVGTRDPEIAAHAARLGVQPQ